ncbi:MAG: DUF4352 domain-containing protein [Clostridium sp.]|uniref:DUF4352 domain-containing protein n=1 Tax=Clostridium sp. TaxID=1506 RepID=UPI002FC9EF22
MNNEKFYNTSWFMWLMLVFVTPVGIFLLWRNHKINKGGKIGLTIAFSVIFLAAVGMTMEDDAPKTPPNQVESGQSAGSSKPKPDEAKKEEKKIYGIGETFSYKGEYEVTIDKVYKTDKRNQFSDKQPKEVVIIEYSYKNISKKDPLFISSMSFKLFDGEGNALETYPVSGEGNAQTIPAGKTSKGNMAYGIDNGDSIEAYYYDNMFNSKEDAVFKLSTSK